MKTSYQTPEMTFTRLLSEDILTSSTTPSNRPASALPMTPTEKAIIDSDTTRIQKRRLP